MSLIIITNNPLVNDRYSSTYDIEFYQKDYMGVLETVRNKIHIGHVLLSHPLAGSIKPNETPYRSILISKEKNSLDMNSLSLIEAAISTTRKFIEIKATPEWNNEALLDFQTVDLSLIENALDIKNNIE